MQPKNPLASDKTFLSAFKYIDIYDPTSLQWAFFVIFLKNPDQNVQHINIW